MNFQFKLNLQRLAKQSYAVSLWEREDTRKKIKEYLYKHDKVKAEDEWQNITKSVIQLLDPATLPLVLYIEMVYVVRDIGLKILDWFNSLKYKSLFSDVDRKRIYDFYFRNIHWTYYGTIDGLKILRSWMNIPDIDLPVIYNMACLYCLEDEIPMLWGRIPRKLRKQVKAFENEYYQKYGYYILAYWLACDSDYPFAMEKFNRAITQEDGDLEEFLDVEQSPEANMLILSAKKGYRKAVEYFWERIDPEEQEKNLVNALSWALRAIGSKTWSKQYHRKEQFIETCIFLMKKLSENSMKKVMEYKFTVTPLFGTEPKVFSENIENIMDLFINIWPWQEFFMTAFNLVKSYFTEKNYRHIFSLITYCMFKDYESGYSVKNTVYQRMFHAVWREMPDSMKSKNVIESSQIQFLFRMWDMPSFRMILNDPFINEMRADLMKQLFNSLIDLLNDNKTEKVDEFVDEVFNGDNKENKIYKFIIKDDFDSLKNLQDSYSKEGFEKIKAGICTESVCHYFITRNELDLADKFLKWIFLKESEIDHFKYEFKEKDFTRQHIYRIWIKSNERTAEEMSEKFIKWFVKTPEELASFKKEGVVIVDEDYDFEGENNYRFYKPFVQVDCYEMVLPLLNWCGIEKYYIEEFKKILIGDVRVPFFMETNEIEKTKKYLKWALNTDELRIDLVRCLVNSKTGFLCCKKFITSCDDKDKDLTESFKKFIKFWIQSTGSVKRIEKKVISWKEKLKKLDEDVEDSEDEWDPWSMIPYREPSDRSINFRRNEIYCPEEKINLFLSVLDGFESGDDPKAADNDDYFDEDTSNSSSKGMSGLSDGSDTSDDVEDDDGVDSDEDDEEDEDGEVEDDEEDEVENDDEHDDIENKENGEDVEDEGDISDEVEDQETDQENEKLDDDDSNETEGEILVAEFASRILETKVKTEAERFDEENENLDEDDGRFDDIEEELNKENNILVEENTEVTEVVEEEIVDDNLHEKCKIK